MRFDFGNSKYAFHLGRPWGSLSQRTQQNLPLEVERPFRSNTYTEQAATMPKIVDFLGSVITAPGDTESMSHYPSHPRPRKDVIRFLERDPRRFRNDKREILPSPTNDPYQPLEMAFLCYKKSDSNPIDNELHFAVLTKSGMGAMRDLHLMERYEKCRFGTTLIFSVKRMPTGSISGKRQSALWIHWGQLYPKKNLTNL